VDEDRATILRLQQIGMRYGSGDEVLRDIDLTLPSGSLHFLVGPSGAGKTSLLRLMSLSHPASRGTITLFGRDVSRLDRAALPPISSATRPKAAAEGRAVAGRPGGGGCRA
jgi:cell division transport system ATP-binding protein